jgi:hypothetical protein
MSFFYTFLPAPCIHHSLKKWVYPLSWMLYFLVSSAIAHTLTPSKVASISCRSCQINCIKPLIWLRVLSRAWVQWTKWKYYSHCAHLALVTCIILQSAWRMCNNWLLPEGTTAYILSSSVCTSSNKSNLNSEFTHKISKLIYCGFSPKIYAMLITRVASATCRISSIPDIMIIPAFWSGC